MLWILEEEALKPSLNELLLVERISTYNGNFFGKFFTLHGMVIFLSYLNFVELQLNLQDEAWAKNLGDQIFIIVEHEHYFLRSVE